MGSELQYVYHLPEILSLVFGFKFAYNNLKTLYSVLIFLQLKNDTRSLFLFLFSIFQTLSFFIKVLFCHLCQAISIFFNILLTLEVLVRGIKKIFNTEIWAKTFINVLFVMCFFVDLIICDVRNALQSRADVCLSSCTNSHHVIN